MVHRLYSKGLTRGCSRAKLCSRQGSGATPETVDWDPAEQVTEGPVPGLAIEQSLSSERHGQCD